MHTCERAMPHRGFGFRVAEQSNRKNCDSRKACPEQGRRDAKAPRFGETRKNSFFAPLAAWREKFFLSHPVVHFKVR